MEQLELNWGSLDINEMGLNCSGLNFTYCGLITGVQRLPCISCSAVHPLLYHFSYFVCPFIGLNAGLPG